ncbi:LysR family transcriptional regulator [Methylobacillus sp.]|uniref:LysR family transcriptional regulator n=1 Tax=Methylobacillus sp. TaxID=56818 RepID=UPI0012C4E285|nr:LysR family transcriptional regulator [Methylobacillus sp.]MPS48015.1 LysR family transcriptional regulator [Methylobacillus sp.]
MHELLSRVSLDELVAFVAVAETSSFSVAAKRMGRDPTILSRRVSQLESSLGVRLLTRTTRRVVLTEVGNFYYPRIRTIIDELDAASLEASNFASSPQGLLRISLPFTFGKQWIAPLIPDFIAQHPRIKVDVRFTDRLVDLVAEGYDIAVRLGTSLNSSSLTAKKIAPFRYVLLAAPKFIAEHGLPAGPEDLAHYPCLGFTSLSTWPEWRLKNGAQRKTIRPEGPLVTDNSEALLMAAIQGAGIILTADWLAAAAIREGALTEVLPGWEGAREGGIYAVMPPGRLIPTKTRLFVDEITASIRKGLGKLPCD